MNFVMDFIVGCLGYFVSMFACELAKGWWKSRPKSKCELLEQRARDACAPRPLPPNFDQRFEQVKRDIEGLKPKRPIPNPSKQYSVAEILAAARKNKAQ